MYCLGKIGKRLYIFSIDVTFFSHCDFYLKFEFAEMEHTEAEGLLF